MKLKKWLLGLVTFAAMAVLCAVCTGAEEYSSGLWKYTKQSNGTVYISAYSGFDDELEIPSKLNGLTVSGIDDEAFYGNTNISKIKFNSNIKYIGNEAFRESSITSVDIPSSVVGFGTDGNTFVDCDMLKKVNFNAKTSIPVSAFENCDILEDVTIGDGTTDIGESAFKDCFSLKKVKFGRNITGIGDYAFYNAGISSINIPNTVKFIGRAAFMRSKISSINIPSSVVTFGSNGYQSSAFSECYQLKKVNFNASAAVPPYAFEKSENIVSVTIGNATTGIDNCAFSECNNLKTIKLGNAVKYIGERAFRYTNSLQTIVFGSNLRTIGIEAFQYSGIRELALPSGLTTIGYFAFEYSSLETVIIPDSVTTWVDMGIFKHTDAFGRCENLKKVYIGGAAMPMDDLGGLFAHSPNVTIYCTKNSQAHKYAEKYGIACSPKIKPINTTSIKFNNQQYTLAVGDTLRLYPVITPQNTTDRIEWISGNEDVAMVNASGEVTGISEGEVAIQIKSSSGKKATCIISVKKGIKSSADSVVKKNISLATVGGAFGALYTGKACTPKVIVTYNPFTVLTQNVDYTVTYTNNVKVGTAKITIKGIGNYTGTVTKTFKITKLPKVSGAKLGGRAADALRVNWTRNASADGYIVEMYKNGKWVRAAKITNKNTTTFRKAGLKASTVYKFRVRAYKMIGSVAAYSDYTATITARTNPSIMKGVKIAGKARDALRVNWTKNTSAQGYIVEMYKGGKWVRVAKITNNNTTTFRKAGLAKNTAYKFRVRAYHMSGKTALYGNYGNVSGRTLVR